jgi:sigma-B regulation protein RsbU (phosphoserine phosphatase)
VDESSAQLRRREAISDPALAHLRTADLVAEVMDRLPALLDIDTVVILLADPAGRQLTASYARGLEEEVHQGVSVPFGQGFAGRIASTRAPLALEMVGPESVVNPLLWTKGLQSMLGVPMIASGALVGVLHVGTLRARHFADEDTTLLQLAADRLAPALRAETMAAERIAARTLQQSLLPSQLPVIEGLEFATRFVAAEAFGVGGDWLDAFKLPGGRIGVVIGDVAGSGLRAAVVMGRLRSALRAYAIEAASPAETLYRLQRKFAHFEPDEMATVLYLVVDADLSGVTVASLGHPPPVMAVPGAPPFLMDCSPSPPIGAHRPGNRVDVRHALPPGATVACYTDGLVERRGEPLTEGLERLREAMYPGAPTAVVSTIMARLIGSSVVQDDTALIVLRRSAR